MITRASCRLLRSNQENRGKTTVETFEFYGELKRETKGAYLLHDGVNEVWLPKSKVQRLKKLRTTGGVDAVTVTIPLWLAKEKGVV